jgi:adenosylcobinamide-GDP ribazoletransferase
MNLTTRVPLGNPLRQLCTALTFLTRLPFVARFAYPDAAALARSAWLWPLIGAAMGGFAGLCFALGVHFWSAPVAALFAIASAILVTGAFHEDGLADSADGLFGGYTPARRLEIMKDSRIGTFGGLALVLMVLLAHSALLAVPAAQVIAALIAGHALGRTSSLPLAFFLRYAREDGANKPVAEGLSAFVVLAGVGSCALVLFGLLTSDSSVKYALLRCLLGAALLWPLAGWYLMRKLGGITGDALGAVNQLTWLMCLLCFALKS